MHDPLVSPLEHPQVGNRGHALGAPLVLLEALRSAVSAQWVVARQHHGVFENAGCSRSRGGRSEVRTNEGDRQLELVLLLCRVLTVVHGVITSVLVPVATKADSNNSRLYDTAVAALRWCSAASAIPSTADLLCPPNARRRFGSEGFESACVDGMLQSVGLGSASLGVRVCHFAIRAVCEACL